jgi:DNA adenine methylase
MKPFLKWAGGKFRLAERIAAQLDDSAQRLIEPFTGSAAIFLNTDYQRYLLADTNADLIALFQNLKDGKDKFIKEAEAFFQPGHNTLESYIEHRKRFNTSNDPREKALLFLYLNRHGYNGLCRYNKSGGFNVPFGRNPKPYFPADEMRFFAHKARKAEFLVADFRATLQQAKSGDTVYADPPYVPLTTTASFTAYDGNTFSSSDQADLTATAKKLAGKGITTVISNHNTEQTIRDYKKAGAIKVSTFDVRRFISCQGQKRENAPELLAVFA